MEYKKFKIIIEMTDGQIFNNIVSAPVDYLVGFTHGDTARKHFEKLQEIKSILIEEIT